MKRQFLLICMAVAGIFTAFADKTVYVASTAQGTADGTSSANAKAIGDVFSNLSANLASSGTTYIVLAQEEYLIPSKTAWGGNDNGGIQVPDGTTKKIVLEGNNATINGANLTGSVRMIRLGASTQVEFKNLNFKNGTGSASSVGGAFYFAGDSLILSGCTFDNNKAGSGGAIASRGKHIKITNSYFLNNKLTGTGRGAAITHTGNSSGGTLVVENTTFSNNTGYAGNPTYGSAICTAYDGSTRNYLSEITITNSTFYKNLSGSTATYGYAAVYLDSMLVGKPVSNVKFVNNTFSGNSNCGIYINGTRYNVSLFNNAIVGCAYDDVSDPSKFDHGIIANKTLANGRPAITAYNNYIVAEAPLSSAISELTTGDNGNTYVSASSQADLDNVLLSADLQTGGSSVAPYLSITSGTSPLVESGISSYAGVTIPSKDVRGVTRATGTSGTKYDIGAFEYNDLPTGTSNSLSNDFCTLLVNKSNVLIENKSNNRITVNAYSANGQKIYSASATQSLSIDKNQLSQGITIFNISNGSKSVTKKVIF